MNFDYNKILREKLYDLQKTLGLSNFDFEVDSEQAFLKMKDLKPDTIYVLTRELQNDKSIGAETQPVQILVLSEQNSLDVSKALFSEFAKKYNFEAMSIGNIWIKQQYSDPVVLSNFNVVDFGYRSVLYISATLYIMEDVIDIRNVKIDDKPYVPLAFNLSYSMSTNTQQLPNKFIATSMKTTSTFAITMTVPLLGNDFVKKVLNIIKETNNTGVEGSDLVAYNGNNPFKISFDCAIGEDNNESYKLTIEKTEMRLISAQLVTAPNQVPGLQLGFLQ